MLLAGKENKTMINIKEIAININKVYRVAFDEGYKKGFIDGKIKGLKGAEKIIDKTFKEKEKK